MSRVCAVTGKRPMSGHNVSHANNKTKRRFLPNLHKVSFWSEILKRKLYVRVSANAVKTIEKNGGIDNYLLSASKSKIKSAELLTLRKTLQERAS